MNRYEQYLASTTRTRTNSRTFKLGDRVCIRTDSPFYGGGPANPANVIGTIANTPITGSRGGLCLVVMWDTGPMNSYRHEDLIHE